MSLGVIKSLGNTGSIYDRHSQNHWVIYFKCLMLLNLKKMELKKCRGGKFRTCRKLSGNSRHLFFFRLMIPTSTAFSFYFTFRSASQTPMTTTAFQPSERKTERGNEGKTLRTWCLG